MEGSRKYLLHFGRPGPPSVVIFPSSPSWEDKCPQHSSKFVWKREMKTMKVSSSLLFTFLLFPSAAPFAVDCVDFCSVYLGINEVATKKDAPPVVKGESANSGGNLHTQYSVGSYEYLYLIINIVSRPSARSTPALWPPRGMTSSSLPNRGGRSITTSHRSTRFVQCRELRRRP